MQQSLYSHLPSKPGVYLFKDKTGKLLYVGKAKDLKKRVSSYFTKGVLDSKTQILTERVHHVDFIPVASEVEAFLLEANLIKKNKPFYNIKLADDKSYPYIAITHSNSPAVFLTRGKNISKAVYFGPYPDVGSVKTVLRIIRKIFPFQTVRNHPDRTCMYYHIGLCPCIPVHPENLPEYRKAIRKLEKFLDGKTESVISLLEKERDTQSKREEFERAANTQKKIEMIRLITDPSYEPFQYEKDPDYYRERVENELSTLQKTLAPYYPDLLKLSRIECYDISNIQGTNATGSMVVLTNGEVDKSQYRRFKIRLKNTPDDYFMMKEMLGRRLRREDWMLPDLLVIDGGKGQVRAALEVLVSQKKSIPLIGLAKRLETIVIPSLEAHELLFFELTLGTSNPGVNLLRRIRDEAHRFAITYHRLLRKKAMLSG